MEYNFSTHSWEIDLAPGPYSIPYSVTVDCSIIPSCIDSVSSSLKLMQFWSATGYTFNFSGSNYFDDQIYYPRFVDETFEQFYGNYLDTISIYHKYLNSGNADGDISFAFEINSSNLCSGIELDTVLFGVGSDADSAIYDTIATGWNSAFVPMGEYLFINKRVVVKSCIDSLCNTERDTLIWKCGFIDAEFCDSCQNILDHEYAVQRDSLPAISIIRMYPDSAGPIREYNCFGSYIPWKYQISNSGIINIAEFTLEFKPGVVATTELNLVNADSIVITPFLSGISSINSSYTLRSNALCNAEIDSALETMYITIHNFMVGDSITLEFESFRCCEENEILFNQSLLFGYGKFNYYFVDSCYTSNWFTQEEIHPQWDMSLDFFPSANTLLYPTGATKGQSTPILNVDYESFSSYEDQNFQLFGCPDIATCQLKGFLKANIKCLPGLTIDTPLVSIVNYPLDSVRSWDPVYYYSSATGTCDTTDYFYYFDLSDTNAIQLIHRGRLNFRLTSCCTELPSTPYNIFFSILFDPDSCLNIDFSDTTHLIPPDCFDCCFLPLASTESEIAVLCPGCTIPGLEIKNYSIQRINYGLPDTDNDNKADYPQLIIDSTYLATYQTLMKTRFANHGDVLQDLMVSHFPDGASDSTGYMYSEILADTGRFNFMHLNRTFITEDTLDIAINPYYFKLYIDIPDSSGTGICMDCDEYQDGSDFRTIHVIEVDLAQIPSYIEYDPPQRIFFTFGAIDTAANLFDNVIYHDTTSAIEFEGYFPRQRYRMKTEYEVCGYFSPKEIVDQLPNHQIQQVNIRNEGVYCGQQLSIATFDTIPDAPGTVDSTVVLNQDFTNSYRFWCTFYPGRFWLYADQNTNNSVYLSDAGNCDKYIMIESQNFTGGNIFTTAYPFEFRIPAFKASGFSAFIPDGYVADTIASIHSLIHFPGPLTYPSVVKNFEIVQTSDSVIVNLDSLVNILGLYCLSDSISSTSFSTLVIGDNHLNYDIRINLIPEDCIPGSAFGPDSSDIKIVFNDQFYGCIDSIVSYCDPVSFSKQRNKDDDSLKTSNPVLTIIGLPPTAHANTNQVCWTLSIDNDSSVAYNVFIFPEQVSFMSNWSIHTNGSVIPADSNNILHYAPNLGVLNVSMIDSLCAVYDSCVVADTLRLIYGWNCSGFPINVYDTSLCFIDSTYINITDDSIAVASAAAHPDTFDLCDPFIISGSFTESEPGFIYPYNINLSEIDSGFDIQSVTIANCEDSTVILTLSGSGENYALNDSILSLIDLSDFTSGACLNVMVTIEATCHSVFHEGYTLIIPNINFEYVTYCGELDSSQARVSEMILPNYKVVYSGVSHCSDCFTIDKTALMDTVIAGDTVGFSIVVCGFNAANDTVILSDILPDNFTATSVIPDTIFVPANSCDTLIVNGIFSQGGNCNDSTMLNVATIYFGGDSLSDDACMHVYSSCAAQADTIIADSSFSSSLGTVISGQTLYLDGRFYVDTTFTLQNCTILVNMGGQIIVLPGASMTTDSTVIEGCDFMWRGILLEQTAIVKILEHSVVRDAETAIFATNKSKHYIIESSIEDCVRGVYLPPDTSNNITSIIWGSRFGLFGSSLKPGYPDQPAFGAIPFSGIELNDVVLSIGDAVQDSNWFNNMNSGILGFRSILEVKNNKFMQIHPDTAIGLNPWNGVAISSIGDTANFIAGDLTVKPLTSGNWTVEDSQTGIYTFYSNLNARQVNMTDMISGVHSQECTDGMRSQVTYCQIEATRYGIFWIDNIGASQMTALGNQIYMDGTGSSGVMLMETNNVSSSNYDILENYVEIRNGSSAISGSSLKEAAIDHNIIRLLGSPSYMLNGIMLENGESTRITCNTITGDDVSDTLKTGILVSISTETQVSCNETDSTGFGFFFGGISPETSFTGNKITNHFEGLRLNNVAVIDTQPHAGNLWIGSYSNYGAVNMNCVPSSNLLESLFEVNSTPDPDLLPSTPTSTPNNVGWFDPLLSGTAFDCITYSVCGSPSLMAGDGGSENLMMLIANDSTLTSDFIPESKVMARQYLYKELQQDISLVSSNAAFEEFVTAQELETTGYLYEVKKTLQEAYFFNSAVKDSLLSSYDFIKQFTDSIFVLDSLEALSPGAYTEQRKNFMQEIFFKRSSIAGLLNQHQNYRYGKISVALQQNTLVQPEEIPELNEKIINEMEVALKNSGTAAIIGNQSLILSVAVQCPYIGGTAVYRARALTSLFGCTIAYDDQSECAQQGIYRNVSTTTNTFQKFRLIPNPANESVEVSITGYKTGTCNLTISNSMNQVMQSCAFNCSSKIFRMNTSKLSQGIYKVSFVIDGKHIGTEKLIIVR